MFKRFAMKFVAMFTMMVTLFSMSGISEAAIQTIDNPSYTALVYNSKTDEIINISGGNLGAYLRKVEDGQKCFVVTSTRDEIQSAKDALEKKNIKFEVIKEDGKINAKALEEMCQALGTENVYAIQFTRKSESSGKKGISTGEIIAGVTALAGLIALFKK